MKMSKLSNQTNSQDPQAVNSRVFVGNLNTFQCSKTDVERMFQRYGRLAGISMHKGYAFVQFTNPFDARNACLGEDGRNILSQTLDVNMVAEPKEHQVGRKRQNVNKTGNDWEYYYDSYYTSTLFPSSSPRPMKRPRLQQQQIQAPSGRLINGIPSQPNGHQQQQQSPSALHNGHHHHSVAVHGHINGSAVPNGLMGDEGHPYLMPTYFQNGSPINGHPHHPPPSLPSLSFKVYSNPDVLICGNCRECFSEITELLDHKRTYCKLRFACKCQTTKVGGGVGNPVASSATVAATPAGAAAAEASSLSTKIPSPPTSPSSSVGLVAAPTSAAATARLLCVVCKSLFQSPWDLMVHVQAAHMINIYELGASASSATQLNQSVSPHPAPTTSEKEATKSAGDSAKLTPNGNETKSSAEKVAAVVDQSPVNHIGSAMDPQSPGNQGNQHDSRFLVASTATNPPENECHAAVSAEVTLRVEGHRENGSGINNTTTLLDDDLQLYEDLENASSSSPISQIEIETGDNTSNKLSNDSALLAFTCPTVVSPTAVVGALSIVSSL